MRSSPTFVTREIPIDREHSSVREAIRALVDHSGIMASAEHCLDATSEVILVDVEIDGARYLLVRMPKLDRNRVQLSPREQEIVRMVAKGHPNKVIADVLNISSWTVCTHLRRIFAKMGVGSRAAMVARLHEIGAISNELRTPGAR